VNERVDVLNRRNTLLLVTALMVMVAAAERPFLVMFALLRGLAYVEYQCPYFRGPYYLKRGVLRLG
jgi:hypothetical protein